MSDYGVPTLTNLAKKHKASLELVQNNEMR